LCTRCLRNAEPLDSSGPLQTDLQMLGQSHLPSEAGRPTWAIAMYAAMNPELRRSKRQRRSVRPRHAAMARLTALHHSHSPELKFRIAADGARHLGDEGTFAVEPGDQDYWFMAFGVDIEIYE
jgi:hypothetical protein